MRYLVYRKQQVVHRKGRSDRVFYNWAYRAVPVLAKGDVEIDPSITEHWIVDAPDREAAILKARAICKAEKESASRPSPPSTAAERLTEGKEQSPAWDVNVGLKLQAPDVCAAVESISAALTAKGIYVQRISVVPHQRGGVGHG